MEYHSAIRKNKITPCAAAWMDLETIIRVRSGRQGKTSITGTAYVWDLNNTGTNTYLQNEMESQMWKANLGVPERNGGGGTQ